MRLKVSAGHPGSRPLRRPGQSGLGSLRRTMPHLKSRFAAGGMPPVEEPPLADFERPGAGGGSFPPEGEALPPGLDPGAEGLPPEGGEDLAAQQQIVMEAMLALEGRHPNPQQAIQAFVEAFGEEALAELQAMVQGQQGPDELPPEEMPVPGEEPMPEQPAPAPEGPGMAVDIAAAGGGLLQGKGSGQSDEIEGTTPSGRPVLLSDGEYVIDAATVSALGDGSTNAGARRLDDFRKQVRKQAYGHDKQARPMAKGGITVKIGG